MNPYNFKNTIVGGASHVPSRLGSKRFMDSIYGLKLQVYDHGNSLYFLQLSVQLWKSKDKDSSTTECPGKTIFHCSYFCKE